MSEQPAAATTSQHLDFLPAHFSADEISGIEMLSGAALEHIHDDPDTTVSPAMVHDVAYTLINAGFDARTVMIFYLSLLDGEERAALKPQFDTDLLEAAHNVSIIRLLSSKDDPKQPPIRKVLLRQLLLKVTHDVRVIIVKIAGRLVMLKHADAWDSRLRQRIAQEVLDVVVPWCDALGLDGWRQELQEMCFKYLSPDQYNYILSLMEGQRDQLHETRNRVIEEINALLERHGVEANVSGRVKTHYAVYRKMKAYELRYDEVWDRIGIRILAGTVFECYYIQMAIEEELYPDRRRFVDYIESPRQPYNYQSLHLTVQGPNDTLVEIQIRTNDMHIKGEYGVAAHWKMYGGGDGVSTSEDKKFAFLRTQALRLRGDTLAILGNTLDELLFNNAILPTDTAGYILDPDSGERIKNSHGEEIYYRDVVTNNQAYIIDPTNENKIILSRSGEPIWYQGEVLPDRVIVYTPNGDLKSLPKHATALDFAYYIHEEVGHVCVGARVNGKLQKLDYEVQMGDRIAINTRQGTRPSLDWLYNGYTRTRRAHEKIKRFFREKTDVVLPEVAELGHTIIKKRMSAYRIRDLAPEKLAEMFKLDSRKELLEAVGMGEISIAKLDDLLGEYVLAQLGKAEPDPVLSGQEFSLLYRQAQCCLPVRGDDAISYITQGRGFTLHRADCRNVPTLDPERVTSFDWSDAAISSSERRTPAYQSRLILLVVQPSKTILFIKEATSVEGVPLESIRVKGDHEMGTMLEALVRIYDRTQLERLIRKLNASDDVLMVRRGIG